MELTVEGIINLVTAGGFGALAWYLVAVRMPKMQDSFDSHSANQQETFTRTITSLQTQFTDELNRRDELYRTSLQELMGELVKALKREWRDQP